MHIQFANALLESGDPKCVKNQVALAICFVLAYFSDVVMSEGVKGMTPAPSLDDSEEIARSKTMQSNCTLACLKLSVFAPLSRA